MGGPGQTVWLFATVLLWPGPVGLTAQPGDRSTKLDFERDIRPILADACFKCHGPDSDARKARLRLDDRDGLFGPTRDAPEDDEPESSIPVRIVVAGKPDASELSRRVSSPDVDDRMPPKTALRQLTASEIELLDRWIAEGAPWSGHWSFEPIRAPNPPAVVDAEACGNEIDRFILAAIEARGVTPSPEADRRTLLRRVTLDLTGLPPTRDEIESFVANTAPDAYERRVDQLLASPRYGEHMAFAWLEAARYADSNGFQHDLDRTAWPWRDWVVRALNANIPFDAFTVEQLAGDLLAGATPDQLVATAFNRNHAINGEGGREIEESRIDYVHDRVDATSTVWLGLTMSCAQCHDHKYDPIPQRDYYRFFAFFNNIDEDGSGDKGDTPPLLEFKDESGRDLKVMVMRERAQPRTAHVLKRGAWDDPGEEVSPATPGLLPGLNGAPPNRLGLARWLVDQSNPLTARVEVNRIWQQIFGVGLVRTPDNFGVQGERPTHPELLDWLSHRLVSTGWDVKALTRLMVTSRTYRRSSNFTSELASTDPENRLLARASRWRLPSGVIRDQALFVSGLLVERIGGPPVKPYHPGGVWEDVSFGRLKYQPDSGEDLYRRTLYTFWRRTAAPVNLFDTSTRQRCSVRVVRTNTPLQALVLMNDPTYSETAAALAERALLEGGTNERSRLAWAMESVLTRTPTDRELSILVSRLDKFRTYYGDHPEEAISAANAGDRRDPDPAMAAEVAAYAGVMSIVLNLDEALSRE